jgi:hypothetical protein
MRSVMTPTYDEDALVARLALLARTHKTAFAAACAQRLLPLFERYVSATGAGSFDALSETVASTWRVVSGADLDLTSAQAVAEGMVPADDRASVFEMGYGQNAAAAAAYAIRTWLQDSPQEAAWAARQVYEAADYAAQGELPGFDPNAPRAERTLLESRVVQTALSGIWKDLEEVESTSGNWESLQKRAHDEGRTWAALLP